MTFERQKMKIPYSFEFVQKVYETFKDNISIFEATASDGNTHAMNFYIADNRSVYYLMSGADPDFRSSSAQNLIHWEAIKHFYGKVKYFDFEGSIIENMKANFRKFGGVQKQYFHIYSKSILKKVKDIVKIILRR